MADDGYTASELRKRYQRGGSVNDCDLSAAQLRSRYAIPSNTFKDHPVEGGNTSTIIIVILILIVCGGAGYFFLS